MKRSYGLLAGLTLVAMVCAQTVCAVPTTYYVSLTGTGNGSSWAEATNDLQGAVDASDSNTLSVVWVSNGWYTTGGRISGPTSTETVSNRVAIWKPITVRSLSGPGATFLMGNAGFGGTNGPGACRGAYVTNGATLAGFTVTNGYTDAVHVVPNSSLRGGGIYCGTAGNTQGASISNCVIVACVAWYAGGGVMYGTLYDSTVIFNTCGETYGGWTFGGGTAYTYLYRCQIISNELFSGINTASAGGGSYSGNRYNCYIAGNTVGEGMTSSNPNGGGGATGWSWGCTIVVNRCAGSSGQAYGGGIGSTSIPGTTDFDGGHLFNCVVSGNSSDQWGGVGRNSWASNCLITYNCSRDSAAGSMLIDCTIAYGSHRRSSAISEGGALRCVVFSNKTALYNASTKAGGAQNAALTNCLLFGNSSDVSAGGASGCTLQNCTIVDNSGVSAGGVDACTLTNSIVWDNNMADVGSTYYYTCAPNASHGVDGNITNNPLLVGGNNYRLTGNSPCIDVGTSLNWMTNVIYNLDVVRNPRVRNTGPDMGAYEAAPPEGTIVLVQ